MRLLDAAVGFDRLATNAAVLGMAILACTPCGDAWSLDCFRRRSGAVPVAVRAPVYGWGRFACWLTIALTYAAAGLSKLRNGGWWWWDATNIRSLLYIGTLTPMPFDWRLSLHLARVPDAVVAALGLTVILIEHLFITVPFFPSARWILPPAAILMHTGTLFLQNALFFDFLLIHDQSHRVIPLYGLADVLPLRQDRRVVSPRRRR